MKASAVNLATFANALCHLNATPLSVAVLAPCAWGENLACGVAWQGVLLGRNGAWRHYKFSTNKMEQCLWAKQAKRKWGSLGGGLLSRCLCYLARLCVKFTRLFTYSYFTKFFTQNSRHFINLTQISSLTQGFFIFLPQIFIQFLLIKDVK